MNIQETRVYRGPNIWRPNPVIVLTVDQGDLLNATSTSLPGFTDRLLAALPNLHAPNSTGDSLEHRLRIGLELPDVLLGLALELQSGAGATIGEGEVRPADETGLIHVVYGYRHEEAGRAAGHLAARLIQTIATDSVPDFDIDYAVAEIANIARSAGLGPSTEAIAREAVDRGIPVVRPDSDSSFVIFGQGILQRRIWATVTDGTNLVAAYTAADKSLTSRLLADAGIPVPDEVATGDVERAVQAAERIGFPVVVKPLDGNHGRGVSLDVTSGDALREAFVVATRASKSGRAIVQRQIIGHDYRVLVVGGEIVAVAERIPAHVVGDGSHTVHELVETVNADPQRGEGHDRMLTRIRTGEQATDYLKQQGLTWDHVPSAGDRVFLSRTANLSTGGTAIDRTDEIHPANIQLAREAAAIVGLDVAGIDIVTPDIGQPITENDGAVVEVNTAPGFRMHTHPSAGQPRPVASAVLDILFPTGTTGRIPIVAVTGTNGKTTTTRMVAHLLRQDGRCVGLTTTDGIYIGSRLAAAGDMAGPTSARSVLRHPHVEAAALETARGGIVREGLGFDQCDVGIVTNVSSDHLGLGGVHTLEDLARVKRVIPESVADSGASVLNADDPLVLSMVPFAKGEVILFSAQEENPAVREHIERGGRAAILNRAPSGEILRLVSPKTVVDLVPAADIPATMGGLIMINAVNGLAASAAAWSLGMPLEMIRAGLRSFDIGFATTPGRFNFLEVEGRHVLIDYAHNVAALQVVGDVVNRFNAPRSVGMVALPGDRADEDHVALGVQTGQIFTSLVIREGNHRGRPVGNSAALIKQGAISVGMPESEIHVVLDEIEATHATVDIANPGDLAVIFVTRPKRIWEEMSERATRAGAFV